MTDAALLLAEHYGLQLLAEKSVHAGVGGETLAVECREGSFILKFPESTAMDHPLEEPQLCQYLRSHGIPASEFVRCKNGEFVGCERGRLFHLQKRVPGASPRLHTATPRLLESSAALLGRIHTVLEAYGQLPEGIGPAFFAYMTPQRALASYRRTLALAEAAGDAESVLALEFRIRMAEHFPDFHIEAGRLTRRGTHGDYNITQLICEGDEFRAVIDWTAACVHPVVWELVRSFAYASPECAQGEIPAQGLGEYLRAYRREAELTQRDLADALYVYIYQLAVCDYYGQYYASKLPNRELFLEQARFATSVLRRFFGENR